MITRIWHDELHGLTLWEVVVHPWWKKLLDILWGRFQLNTVRNVTFSVISVVIQHRLGDGLADNLPPYYLHDYSGLSYDKII